jgi:shikimate 5-dehydrogenase
VSRGRELGALTVGIVGFGRIGQGVARRLSGFSSRIIATDPFLSDEQVRTAGAEPVSLEQLFARADVVTLHTPGGIRLVDSPRLDAMRPASVLINAARGDLVDEAAVAEALRTGKLAAFAADTLDGDTAASASPLLDPSLADSVIVTPHLGAQTVQAVDNMGAISLGEVLAELDGRTPRFPVRAAPRGTSHLKRGDHMGFVGVSTGSSSIMRVFPRWAEILNLPTRTLIGHDLPINASAEQYRSLVQHIRDDPHHRGALVTTHKMRLYALAADLFDELDPFARSCSEISSVAKSGARLLGRAKDPLTVRLALEEFLPEDHFTRTGADVVIMGAGGSGTALSWALSERSDAPGRIVVTARSDAQLEHLREIHRQHGTDPEQIVYTRTDTTDQAATLVTSAAPGSLIVNATGLGKDRPGSPLPDGVVFPQGAYVWEFNYRGSLEFLHQARAAAAARGLHVVDGWRYFIHGWSQVIADVFDLSLTPEDIEQLAEAAEFARQ